MVEEVPSYKTGNQTREEVIAPTESSTVTRYTNNPLVIDGTYTFSYGASATDTQTNLTETTHYTFNNDTGAFTLTSAGNTAVGANGVYAAYKYNQKFTESKIQDLLNRCQIKLDTLTNSHWSDGTGATPDYEQITEEKHDGQGDYNLAYYLDNYPIPDVTTTLNGDVAADAATITVVSTNGFPSSGSISIDNDRIDYTGKTTTTFTGCTSVSAHDDGDTVNSWVVEISNTAEGSAVVWTVIEEDTDYDIAHDTGKITLLRDDLLTSAQDVLGEVPQWLVPNRFRFTGQAGNDSIPLDITHLLILMVSKELYNSQVLNAGSRGTDGFKIEGIEMINDEIDMLLSKYHHVQSDNI
jgi:hypothetical protein